ncbi:calcium-translocating P-type ATPase, SERCA-type, partial [Candidatus Woesearchaeota archaeon]|nr:calcium-translocating P-type ATPase, SERCA-type [Candidatus Woesearchaeota archaeon]
HRMATDQQPTQSGTAPHEWPTLPLDLVYKNLKTSPQGLSSIDAAQRLQVHGENTLIEKPPESPITVFLREFNSPVIWVLLGATVISLFINEWVDAVVIGVILVLNAILGFIQEMKAEKSIEALKKMVSLHTIVLRDSKKVSVDAKNIVPGDVLVLETGAKIPADARIIEAVNLETQEAALTGESTPVEKYACDVSSKACIAEQKNMLFSGTIVTRGRSRAAVVETGMKTQLGKIARLIQTAEESETPLQRQLAGFGKWLGVLTLVVCAVVFLVSLLEGQETMLQLFITAVALAVAAIPEGLPAVVTISLALGVQRMVKKNALMRHLPSVETLGSVTAICADKTGTLTHNEMTVKRLFVDGEDIVVHGSGYTPEGAIDAPAAKVRKLLEIGALCNDSKIDRTTWAAIGDPTEACLITSALKAGVDRLELKKRYLRVDEIPFDSERKIMTTVHKIDGKLVAYIKGAPDILLSKCDSILLHGKKVSLTPVSRRVVLAKNDEYASRALRILGFAYKEIKKGEKKESYEKGLTFVGLQAMIDPPRKEVKEAIHRCERAGIKVIMITGDHRNTAIAIGQQLGIKGKVITGDELDALSFEKFEAKVEDIGIYARVSPEHKVRIVDALQKKQHIIAMTGDGVNDAPALKKADIGIAMGISGTDVAKEASEMILVDDNFTSIVNAVEEGRGIFDNIRKFVNYLLSCNVGEVLVVFLASLMRLPLPLIAVQLLWINLITDGLPAIALGVDPTPPNAMDRKPRKVTDKIMSRGMVFNIIIIGALIAAATLYAFWIGLRTDVTTARTMAFTTIVFLELIRLHMIRSVYKTPFFSNKMLLLALAISLLLQLVVVYTPLNSIFGTMALSLESWIYIGVILAIVFAVGMAVSTSIKRRTHEEY